MRELKILSEKNHLILVLNCEYTRKFNRDLGQQKNESYILLCSENVQKIANRFLSEDQLKIQFIYTLRFTKYRGLY